MQDIKTIMELSVHTLAQTQHDELKKHALKILDEVRKYINGENYDKVRDYLIDSPVVDGWEDEYFYIDFGWREDVPLDIGELITKLSKLKIVSEGKTP